MDEIFAKRGKKPKTEILEIKPKDAKISKKKSNSKAKKPETEIVETIDFSKPKEKVKVQVPKDDFFGDSRGARKQTDDGLDIYLDTELKIGEGNGDTELCPFDCQCCF